VAFPKKRRNVTCDIKKKIFIEVVVWKIQEKLRSQSRTLFPRISRNDDDLGGEFGVDE